MKPGCLLTLFLACIFNNAYAQQTVNVPQGNGAPVLIDGRFSAGEWQDASVTAVAPSVKLYLKQYKGHTFIGVRVEGATPSYVDIFLLTADSKLYNLHASMQIGERLLTGNSWTDNEPAWRWGNHIDWIASEAKIDPDRDRALPLAERFMPYDGMEFQLRRSRFKGRRWRIRIEVRDFAGRMSDIIFPSGSERRNSSRWAILNL